MLFRSSLYETNMEASITAALRWIQDYEAKRTPSTAFLGISVPRGIGKGATSYVLQLNGGASYILKISEPKQIYKDNRFKRHLQRLFAVVEAMDDKEAILSPIFATLRGARLCLVYVPCKTVKRKEVAVTCEQRDTGEEKDKPAKTQRVRAPRNKAAPEADGLAKEAIELAETLSILLGGPSRRCSRRRCSIHTQRA